MKFLGISLHILSLICLTAPLARSEENYNLKDEDYESGLITISEEKGDLFYWLFKPRSGNEEAPLVLWLNGGPGGSSLIGLFFENGPYILEGKHPDIRLKKREISWNEDLYVLYVDQPRGVGFSKCVGDPCQDEICVADDMYVFLLKFFDLHTHFYRKPFFLTGESYAGKYIPSIAQKLTFENNPKINLKGIAIGNPYTDPVLNHGIFSYFLYYKGVITLPQYIEGKSRELLCQLVLWEYSTTEGMYQTTGM